MFRDDFRSGGAPLDTAADWDAAEEEYWQEVAAQLGGTCFDIAQELCGPLDRCPEAWRADNHDDLTRLHVLLSQALLLAMKINPEPQRFPCPPSLLAECAKAAGIATTHNEGE